MVNVVNHYLDPQGRPAELQALAEKTKAQGTMDPKDETLFQGYVLEALRTSPVRPAALGDL